MKSNSKTLAQSHSKNTFLLLGVIITPNYLTKLNGGLR